MCIVSKSRFDAKILLIIMSLRFRNTEYEYRVRMKETVGGRCNHYNYMKKRKQFMPIYCIIDLLQIMDRGCLS